MPLSGRGQGLSPQFRKGGLEADAQFSRRMGATFKDPQDLENKIRPFDFDEEEDFDFDREEDEDLYYEFNEARLPFKPSEYFDINREHDGEDEDDLLLPDDDFYYNEMKRRKKQKTDYEAQLNRSTSGRTSSGNAQHRLSARERAMGNMFNTNFPGGPSVKRSFSQLRNYIRSEVKNLLEQEEELDEFSSIGGGSISGGPMLPLGMKSGAHTLNTYDPENPAAHKKKKKTKNRK